MDEQTIANLTAAWRANPDNLPLLEVVLRALRERGDYAAAIGLMRGIDPRKLPTLDGRLIAAEVLLGADPLHNADDALGLAEEAGDDPRALLVRARALLALGRAAEGRDLYRKAVEANPTLEDPALESLLSGGSAGGSSKAGGDKRPINIDPDPTPELGFPRSLKDDEERPRLRTVANDDTRSEEADRMLVPDVDGEISFADVGGLEGVKEQIRRRIILPFQKPSLFERFRKRIGGGILMYGPPGCGKTMLARATAGECNARFYNVAISDVLDMYIGESEQKLHALFEKARTTAPSVVFFDEIEALGGKRQYSRESASSKIVSQFLSEMDGFARNNSGVLVLGATNVPWAVDPAFRRPGRFDRVLFVPPPDREARRIILDLLLQGRPVAGDIDTSVVAGKTSGFSGADLKNLVETAADEAIAESLSRGEEVPITAKHLWDATRDVRSTAVEWLTTARNYARYANESGQYDEVLEFLKRHGKD